MEPPTKSNDALFVTTSDSSIANKADPMGQLLCYSCMSRSLQKQWDDLSQFFRQPEAFTDLCVPENFSAPDIRNRNCTDFCVGLKVRMRDSSGTSCYVMFDHGHDGHFLGLLWIRGCATDLIDYNTEGLGQLRQETKCLERSLQDVWPRLQGNITYPLQQDVTICSCHSNHCNGAPEMH